MSKNQWLAKDMQFFLVMPVVSILFVVSLNFVFRLVSCKSSSVSRNPDKELREIQK